MLTQHYVFKETDGVKVEVTAFWKPKNSAAPYGIGMKSYARSIHG
jgi:hypothetical protein